MHVPKNLLHIESDSKIELICNRFDSDFLIFQFFFFVLPCIGWLIYLISENSVSAGVWFFFVLIFLLVVYWMVYNVKNKIIFTIENTGNLVIVQGFPLRLLHSIDIRRIKEIYVHKKYSVSNRFSWNTGTTLVQDLIIVLKDGNEINLGNFFQDDHKHYLMKAISEILHKKHRIKYS